MLKELLPFGEGDGLPRRVKLDHAYGATSVSECQNESCL